MNKISRAPTKGAQLQDSQCWGQADALQVAAGAHNPWETKLFKTSWRKKTDFLTQMSPEDPERKYHFLRHSPSSMGGIPEEVPSIALVHIPNSEHQFLGDHRTRHTQQSASGKRSTSVTYTWASVIAYYFKLFLNPIMDLFLFLAGRVLNTFEFWAQVFSHP